MRYTDRKEFLYDPEIFKKGKNVETALRIYKEYVVRYSPVPQPKFFEVDRAANGIDPLWHMPTAPRTQYTARSPIDVYAINQFQKPDWRLTKLGQIPQRRDIFLLSNLILQEIDYFPVRGDSVYWNGYRYMIINCVPPPEAYWHQTGVWLGIAAECVIVPEGDAKPIQNLAQTVPAEVSPSIQAPPLPNAFPPQRFRPAPEKFSL